MLCVSAFVELFLTGFVKYVSSYNVLHTLIDNHRYKMLYLYCNKQAGPIGRVGL
jgi:hypothetical protein